MWLWCKNDPAHSSVVLPTVIPSPSLLEQHGRLPGPQKVRSEERKLFDIYQFGDQFSQNTSQSSSSRHEVTEILFLRAYLSLKPRTTFWMRMTLSVMALSRSISSSMSWWSCMKKNKQEHTSSAEVFSSDSTVWVEPLQKGGDKLHNHLDRYSWTQGLS